MNIVLPESLEPIIRRRIEEEGYTSVEEYVHELILADQGRALGWRDLTDQERLEVERLNQRLLRSLDSGPPIEVDAAYWESKRQRLRQRRGDGA